MYELFGVRDVRVQWCPLVLERRQQTLPRILPAVRSRNAVSNDLHPQRPDDGVH
jgi:hypothetical protein